MKAIILTVLYICLIGPTEQKLMTKTGQVSFEASVPSFEEVAAKNNSVTAIINVETGEFAALALVNAFRFKNALMEEHFNENYAESSKFPKATFKGTINNFNYNELKSSESQFVLNGQLTFHGVTKDIQNCKVTLLKTENGLNFKGSFKTTASAYNIEIPSIVKNKISNDIIVNFMFELVN